MKILIAIIVLLLTLPIKINAYYCEAQEISKLKKMAANINTAVEYYEENDSIYFNVTISNLTKDVYLVDNTTQKKYYGNINEIIIKNYKSGSKIKYDIYPTNSFCNDKLLYSVNITLPSYNKYYKDKLCLGNEEFKYCQKWYKNNLTYEEFKKKTNDYILEKNAKPYVPPNEYKNNPLLEFILRYYWYVLLLIVLGCSIGIYTINKKSKIYS